MRSFRQHDRAGHDSFHLGVKKVRSGRYLLAAILRFDGVRGKTVKITFRIVR